jgi:hypothetical protein
LFGPHRNDPADLSDPDPATRLDKDRIEQPAVSGAYLDPCLTCEIQDQLRIGRVGGERLLDIDVGPMLDGDPREGEVSPRRSQEVHHIGPQLPHHDLHVGMAAADPVQGGALPRSRGVGVAHGHDLDTGDLLEGGQVVRADAAASNQGYS